MSGPITHSLVPMLRRVSRQGVLQSCECDGTKITRVFTWGSSKPRRRSLFKGFGHAVGCYISTLNMSLGDVPLAGSAKSTLCVSEGTVTNCEVLCVMDNRSDRTTPVSCGDDNAGNSSVALSCPRIDQFSQDYKPASVEIRGVEMSNQREPCLCERERNRGSVIILPILLICILITASPAPVQACNPERMMAGKSSDDRRESDE
ncbi:hypothetical protein Bbelb_181370 [Branchiostoma belcheri]|nr:hypothetical protein Bbelb_181370 [Branchiostoma belcheri]